MESENQIQKMEQEYRALIDGEISEHRESAKDAREYILNSTAKYHNRVVRTLYMPKIFTDAEVEVFEKLVEQLFVIFRKVITEFQKNESYRELFGFPEELNQLILREPTYDCMIPMARIDVFYQEDTGEFQFCEFNTDGTSAMNEDRELNHALKLTKAYQKMAEKYEISSFELFDSWAEEFLTIYQDYNREQKRNSVPNVVITDFMEVTTVNELEIFRRHFEEKGMHTEVCDICKLKWDGVYLRTPSGMIVDAVYRRAVTSDIMKHYEQVEDFLKAVRAEAICLIGDFRTQIVHNKILYKVLHMDETKEILTAEENEFIRAHVPYTVSLTEKLFLENPQLKEEVYGQKNRWIIKPEDSYGSKGVHAGVECTEEEWKTFVEECVDGSYILQRFYVPYSLKNIDLADDTKEACWRETSNLTGLFVYGEKFRGIYSRISFDQVISTQYNEMTLPTVIMRKRAAADEVNSSRRQV